MFAVPRHEVWEKTFRKNLQEKDNIVLDCLVLNQQQRTNDQEKFRKGYLTK